MNYFVYPSILGDCITVWHLSVSVSLSAFTIFVHLHNSCETSIRTSTKLTIGILQLKVLNEFENQLSCLKDVLPVASFIPLPSLGIFWAYFTTPGTLFETSFLHTAYFQDVF